MKTYGWWLMGLALMALTGCGMPQFTIVLKGGETIVPEKVIKTDPWFPDDWKEEELSPEVIAQEPVTRALGEIGAGKVARLLTKQDTEHGLRYRFYVTAFTMDHAWQILPEETEEPLLSCTIYALELTNLSSVPKAIERIEAETQDELPGGGTLRPLEEGQLYVVSEENEEFYGFFAPVCNATMQIAPVDEKHDHLKGVLPVGVTLAPNEARTYYAISGCVASPAEADLLKAVELCRERVKPLLAKDPNTTKEEAK